MDNATFIQALDLESREKPMAMSQAFQRLHDIPHTFLALNWHSSHEFLYISKHVNNLTGHSYENFSKNGIMFLFSVTPPDKIDQISTSLYHQISELDGDPKLITQPVTMSVDGAIIDPDGQERDFRCLSTILDYIPGQRKTFLVLSSYVSLARVDGNLESFTEHILELQKDLQQLYIRMNPKRFRVFKTYSLLTPRELEIAALIREGNNSKSIAEKLSIAVHTVTSHRKNMLKKMQAGNTTEMVHMLNQI